MVGHGSSESSSVFGRAANASVAAAPAPSSSSDGSSHATERSTSGQLAPLTVCSLGTCCSSSPLSGGGGSWYLRRSSAPSASSVRSSRTWTSERSSEGPGRSSAKPSSCTSNFSRPITFEKLARKSQQPSTSLERDVSASGIAPHGSGQIAPSSAAFAARWRPRRVDACTACWSRWLASWRSVGFFDSAAGAFSPPAPPRAPPPSAFAASFAAAASAFAAAPPRLLRRRRRLLRRRRLPASLFLVGRSPAPRTRA